jgi:hypothetical protein
VGQIGLKMMLCQQVRFKRFQVVTVNGLNVPAPAANEVVQRLGRSQVINGFAVNFGTYHQMNALEKMECPVQGGKVNGGFNLFEPLVQVNGR